MDNFALVSVSPDRPNIYYEVLLRTNMVDDLKFLVDSLRDKNGNASRNCILPHLRCVCKYLFSFSH